VIVQVCVSHYICGNALGAARTKKAAANEIEQNRTFHAPSVNSLRQSR
jgi:hypothetical protein